MEKAIINKEWIKTWRVFLMCLVISVAMAVYAVLRMNRLIELKGAEHLWLIMLLKDNSFVDVIRWTPLLCGVAIGIAQMLPEMAQKRLKLTLHLPYPQRRMVLVMLGCGVAELVIIYLLQTLILAFYDASILPWPLLKSVLLTILPWFLSGVVAYLFTAAVCIEGRWGRRILLALIAITCVMIFFEQAAMGAYSGMIWLSIIVIALLVILPLGSVIRFKEGLQD